MNKITKEMILVCMLILLVGCQKEEQICNVIIYSNGTAIFTPESCNPNYNDVYVDFDLNKLTDNYRLNCMCPIINELCKIENCSITYTYINESYNES